MARGDSFVVETNVHFPADTSRMLNAIRKVIELTAKLSNLQGLSQWRQYRHVNLSLKKDFRVVQKLKHSTSEDPEKQEKANKAIKQAYLNYCNNVEYQLLMFCLSWKWRNCPVELAS